MWAVLLDEFSTSTAPSSNDPWAWFVMTTSTQKDYQVDLFARQGYSGRPSIRHLAHSSLSSVVLRCTNIASVLVAMRVATSYFGVERFAVWATILSLEALFTFADLGLGNSLISIIASANDRPSRHRAQATLSCAIVTTGGLSVILAMFVSLVYSWGMLSAMIGVGSPLLAAETNLALLAYLLCLLVGAPLAIFEKVQMAMHRTHVAAVWRAVIASFQLAVLIVCVMMKLGMPACVLGYSSVVVLLSLLRAFFVMKQYPDLRPTLTLISFRRLGPILQNGSQFLAIQVAMAVVTASDQVILLREAGAIEAARYAIPARALLALPSLIGFALLPAWPAYAAASAAGDIVWIRRTNRVILATISAISASLTIGAQLAGPALLQQWAPRAPVAGRLLLFSLSVWAVAILGGTAVGMLLTGLDRVLPLALCAAGTAVVCLPLKVRMADVFGAPGVAWANVAAYGCCAMLPCVILMRRSLRSYGEGSSRVELIGRPGRGVES
jgi:O-antigen/teichoic acid export membrane protein